MKPNWITRLTNTAITVICTVLPASAWADTPKPFSPEIAFDASRGEMVVRLSPRELRDVKLPFPVRERLTVLENGVPQPGVNINVEHSPITLGVLMENGGRSNYLNEAIASEALMLLRPLVDSLEDKDRLAIFAYDDSLHTVVDFATKKDDWDIALSRLPKPKFSESNFHDAAVDVLRRLQPMAGPKALLVMSTGLDTFSRASFEEVLAESERVQIPVYVFDLGASVRRRTSSPSALPTRIDWARCAQNLDRLGAASGGRVYREVNLSNVQATYDEIVEEQKVRYVLTYTPSVTTQSQPRTVQVVLRELPLEKPAVPREGRHRTDVRVIAQATYDASAPVARN